NGARPKLSVIDLAQKLGLDPVRLHFWRNQIVIIR
ncbi:MAG: transposase-like protein, partial [Sediminicola sp.]